MAVLVKASVFWGLAASYVRIRAGMATQEARKLRDPLRIEAEMRAIRMLDEVADAFARLSESDVREIAFDEVTPMEMDIITAPDDSEPSPT